MPRSGAVTIPRVRRGGARPAVPVPERGPANATAFGSHNAGGAAKAGLRRRSFSRHTLRIGAATAAARVGCPEEKIKALGRWKSNAYKRYIRLAGVDIAKVSSLLGGADASK